MRWFPFQMRRLLPELKVHWVYDGWVLFVLCRCIRVIVNVSMYDCG